MPVSGSASGDAVPVRRTDLASAKPPARHRAAYGTLAMLPAVVGALGALWLAQGEVPLLAQIAPWAVLMAGVAFSGLALVIMVQGIQTTSRADALVQVRTAELAQSEAQYRTLVDTASDLIWSVDEKGRLTYLNPAAHAIYGRSPATLMGQRWAALSAPTSRADDEAAMQYLLDGHWMSAHQTRHVHSSGRKIPLRVSARPIRHEGRVVGATGTATDLSRDVELLEAQAHREAQAKELQDLQEKQAFRTQFINNAAHELNTPLTPLHLDLQMWNAEGGFNDRQRARITRMNRAMARFSALVRDLLEAGRLDAGKMTLEKQRVDLLSLVEETVEDYEHAAKSRRQQLLVACESAMVEADPLRMNQVLDNLLSNAIKYTPEEGAITIRCVEDEGRIGVAVEDTGEGWKADQAGELFAPFGRLHRGGEPGTGLGLYLAQGLMEAHGGSLDAHSDGPGQGAVFTAWLPHRQIRRPARPARGREGRAEGDPPGRGRTVEGEATAGAG